MAAAWLKGGHPERLGATATLVAFAISYVTHPWRIGGFYVGDAVLDLGMAAFFAWLALRTNRWWPLAMTGIMILTLLVHASGVLIPHLSGYADISARIGLGILGALILFGGVVERWLAGEKAVSDRQAWSARGPATGRPESPPSRPS